MHAWRGVPRFLRCICQGLQKGRQLKENVAEEICSMVDEIFQKMQILNNYAITNCEEFQIEQIVHSLTVCVAELDLKILEPVYREYPKLKPKFLP